MSAANPAPEAAEGMHRPDPTMHGPDRRAPRVARPRTAVLAAAAAMLVGACGGGWSPVDDLAVTYRPDGVGMDALLEGVLRTADGCLVVETPDGAVTIAVPRGSTVNDDATEVRITRSTVAIGDPVSFGGGFTSRMELTVPEACSPRITGESADEVFVVTSVG